MKKKTNTAIIKSMEELLQKSNKPNDPDHGGRQAYSVLAPLVERGGKLHMLYELRSDELRRQPGEVSFPGGRIEDGETAEDCAIRETVEELGIAQETIRVLGELDRVTTHDGFSLCCYLALLNDSDFDSLFNPAEVKEVFLTPIDFLLNREPTKFQRWHEYRYKDYVIWGLTARLTMKFVELAKKCL